MKTIEEIKTATGILLETKAEFDKNYTKLHGAVHYFVNGIEVDFWRYELNVTIEKITIINK